MIYDRYMVFCLHILGNTSYMSACFSTNLRQDDDPEAFEDDAGRNSLWRGINPVGYIQRMIGGVYHVNCKSDYPLVSIPKTMENHNL